MGHKIGAQKSTPKGAFLCPDFDMPPIICKFSRAKPVGAKLARDNSGSACINVGCAAVIASKLCSHRGGLCSREIEVCRRSSVGAGMGHKIGAQKSTPKGAFLCLDFDMPPIICKFSRAKPVGAKLARDNSGSACINVGCAAVIASKLCSHRGGLCSREIGVCRRSSAGAGMGHKIGAQKSTPKGAFLCLDFDMPPIICKFSRAKPVGAKLARDNSGSACINVGCAAVIASKLCSHRGGLCSREIGGCRRSNVGTGMGHKIRAQKKQPEGCFLCPDFDMPPIICKFSRAKPVGAKLARDNSGSACINVGCAAVIASKLCSHRGGLGSREIEVCRRSTVGAGWGIK
ncbi:hypothetical protein SAMN04490188_3004 [Pseudomonas kilonensis]|uniref:Uncharacterized protein n=1 Tax=Pseudomonas kilonensis TaxID=132476 RepID=A0ABY0Z2A4_9PSED|nr:hypothetical protein SAMN04490188_3004 [Pseudomonas kilonensis]